MARTRSIKPEFWDDEKLASISRDARLTFIGMWNNSDDYAVVKGHPNWLKNQIFPYEDIKLQDFVKWLKEIESINCIVPFDHEGEKYYYIRNFLKHQTINRPSNQRNPEPSQEIIEYSLNTHGALIDETETETETGDVRNKKFIPPTIEEISQHCIEQKSTINPEAFFNYYTSNGWMVGKNKMKDWKAAVRTWEAKEREKEPIQKASSW